MDPSARGPRSGELAAQAPGPAEAPLPHSSSGWPVDPQHSTWMGLALDQARLAMATGDVPVGAVVLSADGELLGAGGNRREADGDPTAHAEVLALRAAARSRGEWRLDGCTLVVTLEPCVMCAGACVLARVDRLVFGAWDPKAGAAGSIWDLVRDRRANHRVEVVGGIREQECTQVLLEFFGRRRVV